MRRRTNRVRIGPGLVAAAALAAVSNASAQSSGLLGTGTLRPVNPAGGEKTRASDARVVGRAFAQCTLRRGRASSEKWLRLPFASPAANSVASRVFVDDCMGAGEYAVSNEIMRGGLFEQLYLSDFGRSPALDLKQVPAIDYRAAYGGNVPPAAYNVVALGEFGDCVSRRNSAGVRALLLTEPGTAGEAASFGSLKADLGPCVPAGRNVSFSRSVLRAGLAEGLYRLTRAASGKPWTTAQ